MAACQPSRGSAAFSNLLSLMDKTCLDSRLPPPHKGGIVAC